jgi:hypothetical protein
MDKKIFEMHQEHAEWLNKLSFYKDELSIMKNRLAEIAQKNTSGDVLAQVEHFQNQFIVQAEQLDIVKHNINEHEEYLQQRLNENQVAADRQSSSDSPQIRESVESFERIFNGLRQEFNQFLSKTI